MSESFAPEIMDEPAEIARKHRAGARLREAFAIEDVTVEECLLEVETVIRVMWSRFYKLDVQVSEDLPRVNCDPVALQAAVVSLLLNAREAMPNGGVISLCADAIAESDAPAIQIRVSDAGLGMTPEMLARAFEPFFTTKCDGLGGVGLPMVERFVHEARGRVLIESNYGIGTTVAIRLPALAGDSNPRPVPTL